MDNQPYEQDFWDSPEGDEARRLKWYIASSMHAASESESATKSTLRTSAMLIKFFRENFWYFREKAEMLPDTCSFVTFQQSDLNVKRGLGCNFIIFLALDKIFPNLFVDKPMSRNGNMSVGEKE